MPNRRRSPLIDALEPRRTPSDPGVFVPISYACLVVVGPPVAATMMNYATLAPGEAELKGPKAYD